MNLTFFKGMITSLVKHFTKNGRTYAQIFAGVAFGSVVAATACAHAFKKLEKKHRKEDTEKYKAEFAQQLKELENRYKHNEYLLKQKINELCDEFGIDHIF